MTPSQKAIMCNTLNAMKDILADKDKTSGAVSKYLNDPKSDYKKHIADLDQWNVKDIQSFCAAFHEAYTNSVLNALKDGANLHDGLDTLITTYIPKLTTATNTENRLQSVSDNIDGVLLAIEASYMVSHKPKQTTHELGFFAVVAAGTTLAVCTAISAAFTPK